MPMPPAKRAFLQQARIQYPAHKGCFWIRRSLRSLIVHAEFQAYLVKLGLKKVTADYESSADESYALVA